MRAAYLSASPFSKLTESFKLPVTRSSPLGYHPFVAVIHGRRLYILDQHMVYIMIAPANEIPDERHSRRFKPST